MTSGSGSSEESDGDDMIRTKSGLNLALKCMLISFSRSSISLKLDLCVLLGTYLELQVEF
jgi:hypothetical protein